MENQPFDLSSLRAEIRKAIRNHAKVGDIITEETCMRVVSNLNLIFDQMGVHSNHVSITGRWLSWSWKQKFKWWLLNKCWFFRKLGARRLALYEEANLILQEFRKRPDVVGEVEDFEIPYFLTKDPKSILDVDMKIVVPLPADSITVKLECS